MKQNKCGTSRRSCLSVIAIALLPSIPIQSHAQWAVIDLANIVQTTITAIEAVAQTALQYEQYYEQIKSNLAKLEGLEAVLAGEVAGGIAATFQGNADMLTDALKDGKEVAETLKSWYGASNKSPEEFLRQLAKQKAAGDQKVVTLLDHYQSTGATIQETHASLQKMNSSIKNINGPTEGLQAVAAAVGILARQNSAMLNMMQMDTLQKAEDQAKRNGAIDADRFQEDGYKKRKAALELFLKK
jgi:type IV secretion system protein TrbJ